VLEIIRFGKQTVLFASIESLFSHRGLLLCGLIVCSHSNIRIDFTPAMPCVFFSGCLLVFFISEILVRAAIFPPPPLLYGQSWGLPRLLVLGPSQRPPVLESSCKQGLLF